MAAQNGGHDDAYLDSCVEVSLITCSPHEEVYSLYGHTALRLHNLETGEDKVFNYGIFSFSAPHFVLRFIFGLTDYELGVGHFPSFCRYYARWGSMVTEQLLDLNAQEKRQIIDALNENARPENRVYRYNFFFDNCATRSRDIIEHHVEGSIEYEEREGYTPTFREMLHEKTSHHPWATFGNDLLLGVKADRKASRAEQEFLPENLRTDFSRAVILSENGTRRALVKEERVVVQQGVQQVQEDFPFTPMQCALFLLLVSIILYVVEAYSGRTFVVYDVLLMTVQGLAGSVLFVMIFSQHPATSLNLQLLLLNPLPLFFLPSVIRRRSTRWFRILPILILLFFLGSFWQDYAEGMELLALCLLTRVYRRMVSLRTLHQL